MLVRINFLVNKVYDGWTPLDKRLGGTEESIIEWAKELNKRGHKVKIYQNGFEGTVNGVKHLNREKYIGGEDICINIKSSEIEPAETTLYLTNETDATDKDLSKYAGVIWPSQWAVDNIPVNNRTFILPHGYDSKEIYPGKKILKQCLYASSPDRGLNTLLRAWSSVMRAHPDATLLVTYGGQEYDIEGVKFLGDVDSTTMNELYRTSDIWAYPCNGGELYCMTGIKAQVSGCVPVVIPAMALAETVRYGYTSTKEDFTETLVSALDETKQRASIRKEMVADHYVDWEESTSILLDIIESVV